MNTLLVGYDLRQPGQDYKDLIARLESYPYWHCLDSTWLVLTTKDRTTLRDELWTLMDANDKLVVIDVSGDGRSWMGFDQACADWLRQTFR